MMDAMLAALLFAVGLGFLAASVGILYRHAIPRAPRLFHLLTVPPGLVVGITSVVLAGMFLSGSEGIRYVAGVFVAALAVWIWSLNMYAVFHYLYGRGGTKRVR